MTEAQTMLPESSLYKVALGQSLQVKVTGGVPPYQYALLSGSGAIDESTGVFVSSNSRVGTTLVAISDSSNSTIIVNVETIWSGVQNADYVTGNSLRLNWDLLTGANSYYIYKKTSLGLEPIGTALGTSSHFTVTGLTPNQEYTFIVRASTFDGLDKNDQELTQKTASVTAHHAGWKHVKALGGRNPVAHATGLTTEAPSVSLSWHAMTLSSGTIDKYNIYRSTTLGVYDFTAPLATNLSASTRTYLDLAVSANTTYYYLVRPVVGSEVVATNEVDSEIKVVVPPVNMSLVHRWIVNQEACVSMGKNPDRDNNYRCAYTGIGNSGGFYDIGHSFLMDTVELGCNYTDGNACGGGSCLGFGSPNGSIMANLNTVFYDRSTGRCYINTDGATAWLDASAPTITSGQILTLSSNRPGLPPLMYIETYEMRSACGYYTVPGLMGGKRLPRRKEFVAAAAWDAELTDAQITSLEYSTTSLVTTNGCNTNNATGIVFDDNNVPANIETIPFTLSSTEKALRTGGLVTTSCVSRYGIQDLVGNVSEWGSDMVQDFIGVASLVEPGNNDIVGWDFSAYGPRSDNFIGLAGASFLLPMGLPVVGSTDGTVPLTSLNNIHNDGFSANSGGLHPIIFGSGYSSSSAGRYSFSISIAATTAYQGIGGRCVKPLDE